MIARLLIGSPLQPNDTAQVSVPEGSMGLFSAAPPLSSAGPPNPAHRPDRSMSGARLGIEPSPPATG
jgi:hypothetical protein